jgi:hypothetical protein
LTPSSTIRRVGTPRVLPHTTFSRLWDTPSYRMTSALLIGARLTLSHHDAAAATFSSEKLSILSGNFTLPTSYVRITACDLKWNVPPLEIFSPFKDPMNDVPTAA